MAKKVWVLAVMFATLAWTALAADIPIEIAHFTFNGNLNDSSSLGIHGGTWGNGTNTSLNPKYDTGIIGQAVRFIALQKQNITINNPQNMLNLSQNFTITFWTKLAPQTSDGYAAIFSKGNSIDDLGFEFWIRDEIPANEGDANFLTYLSPAGGATITSNTKYLASAYRPIFYAVTRNSTNITLYINGTFDELSNTYGLNIKSTDKPFIIGNTEVLSNYGMNGWIDDFRIFNETLDAAQIAAIYNGGVGTEVALADMLGDFYNCSGQAGNISLNFSIWDEQTPASLLEAQVEVAFEIWQESEANMINRTYLLNGSSSYAFCLAPNSAVVQANAYFKYTTADGYTHRYYFNNQTLSNTTTYINAYDFDTTTGITQLKFSIRDENTFLPLSDIYTSLQKYYTGEGLWRTVQMDRSGEFGETNFNIIERSEDYRFVLRNVNNTLIKQTDTAKIICTATPCELTTLTTISAEETAEVVLGVDIDYNNNTRYMTISWNDPEGVADSVNIKVSKETMSRSITICEQTVSGPTGSMTCNASVYTPPYVVTAITTASPPRFSFMQTIGTADRTFQTLIGGSTNGAFLSGIVLLVVGTAGIGTGIAVSVALLIGGLVIVMFLSTLSFVNITLVAVLGIATVFIAAKIIGQKQ